ncbi:MAG: hypothetical protein AAF605_04100 [Myxococcota bacterium]
MEPTNDSEAGAASGVQTHQPQIDVPSPAAPQIERSGGAPFSDPASAGHTVLADTIADGVRAQTRGALTPRVGVPIAQADATDGSGLVSHPAPAGETGSVGSVSTDVLRMAQLSPIQGQLDGAPLAIADQPESYSTPGVLLSTIGPIQGRDDTIYDFQGEARFFGLTGNKTGVAQNNWIAVQNTSDEPLTLNVRGTSYSKRVTPTDGSISFDYAQDRFQGPHAVTAMSFLNEEPGVNGYVDQTITIPPGETRIVHDVNQHPGGEVFHVLDLTAANEGQTFRLANGVTPGRPTQEDLNALADNPEGAGIPENFNPAGDDALGRPHGVVLGGQQFTGERSIDLQPGQRAGELLFATRFKNAGSTEEIGELYLTGGVPPESYAYHPDIDNPRSATTSDGNYGTTYDLDYTLENNTGQPLVYDVYFTAPRLANESSRPLGGELTMPMRVNGEVIPVRVNGRGEGVMVAEIEVPPGSEAALEIELTNVGNTVPPAGFEFRARQP